MEDTPATIIQRNRERLKEYWKPGTWPAYWGAMDYEINIRILWEDFMYDYMEKCHETCNTNYRRIGDTLTLADNIDALHAVLGMAGEAGELVDIIKGIIFYNKVPNVHHVKEEIGDLLWYVSLLLKTIDSSYEEVMEMNIEKLKKRYAGGKFDEKLAQLKQDQTNGIYREEK